jgi:hypothetical protein
VLLFHGLHSHQTFHSALLLLFQAQQLSQYKLTQASQSQHIGLAQLLSQLQQSHLYHQTKLLLLLHHQVLLLFNHLMFQQQSHQVSSSQFQQFIQLEQLFGSVPQQLNMSNNHQFTIIQL